MMRQRGLQRRTPLTAKTELRRQPQTPAEDTRLSSAGPVKPRRRDTGPSKAVKDLVHARAGGHCEFCGMAPAFGIAWVMDVHHRRPRALGGTKDPAANLPSNLVLLHRNCHEWLESNRTAALKQGWLVPQGHDPAAVALAMATGTVWLTDDGAYVAVPQAKAIRERLEAHAWEDGFLRHADAAAAIQAVLDLHPPIDRGTGPQCAGCATTVTFTPWPCGTVIVVADALGVSGGNPSPGGER